MAELKNKQQLADAAISLASSYDLVQREVTTFIPVHWETGSPEPIPPHGERIWVPLSRDDKRRLANMKYRVLFSNDGELRNFDFMVRQLAIQQNAPVKSILIKTEQGLMKLDEHGQLIPHDDVFTPNYVRPMLNDDPDKKTEVYDTIVEWVGGEEDAESLLYHLATSLAPAYSAVKYVLLLGEGRNGKSVLLTMLAELFGQENVSSVSRQMMAERSPTCVELNDKLLNVIFDGEMSYIKDSSMEKTLIAGEPGTVRMLYESSTTTVQTNALFIEALNTEPKARDKSSALQKRLVRFRFPNVYEVDKEFSKKMTSEPYLGALLSLLIDHYVPEADISKRLAPTQSSLELQMDQVWITSPILQFLETLIGDPAIAKLESGDMEVAVFLASFKPWAQTQNLQDRSDGDLTLMMQSHFDIGWKKLKGVNRKRIKAIRPETLMALEQMKGQDNGTQLSGEELVGD